MTDLNIVPRFADLRQGEPWIPYFHHQPTLRACADRINRPHEDYPRQVNATVQAIRKTLELHPAAITTGLILQVHSIVFAGEPHAGRLRRVPVRIGRFIPPRPDLLPRLPENLEPAYAGAPLTADTLASWYTDFETIHPFQDGNGRTGGIIVAAPGRQNDRSRWLTPGRHAKLPDREKE